jgi:hypothetical protein
MEVEINLHCRERFCYFFNFFCVIIYHNGSVNRVHMIKEGEHHGHLTSRCSRK